MKIIAYVTIGISMSTLACAESTLERYFHHRMPASSKEMQAGQIVFYFSGTLAKPNPVLEEESCEILPSQECVKTVASVFVANTKATQQMIDQFNNDFKAQFKKEPTPYYIKLVKDTKKNGLTFLIGYDPQKISFDHGTFVSIGARNAGFGFRFYNQDFANALNKNSNRVPLLRLASGSPVHLVIDCGHGGKDFGAIGNNVCEKEVSLAIGQELAKLAKSAGYEVTMTRDSDKELLVDARTSWINAQKNKEILVSIHANASTKKEVCGIETFCADNNLFNIWYSGLSARDAHYANSLARSINDTSFQLATHIHRKTVDQVRQENPWIADRGVRQTISQMLIGTTVPAATLVEVGYLTHPKEGMLLAQRKHQQQLAQGIFSGIQSFVQAKFVVA